MRYVYVVAGWLFGGLFGLVGLTSLFVGDWLPSIPLIAIAFLLLPPSRDFAHTKTGITISGRARVITAFLLVGLFGHLVTNSQDHKAKLAQKERERAAAKSATDKQEALLADFNANREHVLDNARTLLASGDFQEVIALDRKYSPAKDASLRQLAKDAQSAIDRANAAAETRRILSEIATIQKEDAEKLAASYTRLSELNPDNQDYSKKARTHTKQLSDQREAERVAAEKLQQAEVAATARRTLIEAHFSPWDGSHRNLERAIKESMKNPDSYDHVKTVYSDKGSHLIVQTTFRGTNSFGGIVPNTVKAKVSLNGDVLQILSQE